MGDAVSFWTAYIGCGLLCVLLAYLGGRRRRLRPVDLTQNAAAVECATCGYDVRGLPGHICPECGSDLNEIGRVTPQFRRWQKVPPLLRAIVWTTGVAAVAAFCVEFARWDGRLPVRVERSLVNHYTAASADYEVEERHEATLVPQGVGRVERGTAWLDTYPSDAEIGAATDHTLTVRGYPGVTRNRPPTAVLRWNLRSNRWTLSVGGAVVDRGSGMPGPDAVLALTHATQTASSPAPTTTAASGPTVALSGNELLRTFAAQASAEVEAALLARSLIGPLTFVADKTDGEAAIEPYRRFPERLGPTWRDALPEDLFFTTSSPQAAAFFYGGPPVLVQGWKSGSGGVRVFPSSTWLVLAAGFWLLVWLAGLPFVLRRAGGAGKHDDARPLQQIAAT